MKNAEGKESPDLVPGLEIEYEWPNSAAWPNLVIGLMLLAAALFSGLVQHFAVPALLVGLIGIGVLYNGLKLWLNRTTISATSRGIRVSTGPIPFGRPRSFPSEGLVEFFVATPIRRIGSLTEPMFTIFVSYQDAEPRRLVDAVPTKEVAADIRHRLLSFYGLKDLDG